MPFIVPRQGFRDYAVYKKGNVVSKAGSVGKETSFTMINTLKGITTSMSPKERETYKQNGYEVSDKVVQYGPVKAEKGNYLVYIKDGKYHFYEIKAVRNPAKLDHFSVYIVNERPDLQYYQSDEINNINGNYYSGSDINFAERFVIGR